MGVARRREFAAKVYLPRPSSEWPRSERSSAREESR
jgi:hypothetical protein